MKENKPKAKKVSPVEEVVKEVEEKVEYHRRERHGGIGAVILITVGTILLLNNLNIIPWAVWDSLWKFWPVLIIMAGVEALFGKSWFADLVVTLIGITITWLIVANVLSLTVPEFNKWLTNNFPQSKIPTFQNYLREKGVK